MYLFHNRNSTGLMDQIRCDEQNYLIWKWHPKGTISGENKRENAIRWGSSIRIKDGEAAVFVYNQKNGTYQDYIVGPYDGILKTDNLPVIANIIGLAYGGDTPFQAEIYYINLAQLIQVRFGVPFFDVYDPRFADYGILVAVRGTISFKICDVGEFVKLHRLQEFSVDDFQKQIRDAVCRYVKDTVANAPAAHNIPAIQLETKTAQINDAVEFDIRERMKDSFGIDVSGVDIGAIEIDKQSDSYRQLMAVTKDIAATRVQAETADYVERLRIQREEGQYAQHKTTQSANFAAYQVEAQTQIGVAGAEALGKMGANSAGGVDLGGSGVGFNPAAMMAGMAVGGAVGQNIVGAMNGVMSGINQQPTAGSMPPPIPTSVFHVAVNGQATGPYDLAVLNQMATAGQLKADSLVWKSGMAQWEKAGTVAELINLFGNTMPSTPPVK